MARLSTSLSSCVLLVVFLFGQLLQAVTFDTRHEPQGKLKVRLDYDLVNRGPSDASVGNRRWMFSTYLVFRESTESISNGQLKSLAVDAYNEMLDDFHQYVPAKGNRRSRSLPSAMAIMAFGNKIILASSQKGAAAFFTEFESNPISTALTICSRHWNEINADRPDLQDQGHMRGAKCGEVSAFWLYYQLPEDHPLKIGDLIPKARVTTVAHVAGRGVEIIEPCGTGSKEEWGCNLLVTKGEPVTYIRENIDAEPYDLGELAGGLENVDQISACTRDVFE